MDRRNLTPDVSRAPAEDGSRPRVGVGVLIVDHHCRVLLTLRNLPPESGCWSIVGGKLEYLETLAECALREAREEVGVDVSIEGLLCVTDHLLPQESQHWVSPAYWCRVARGCAKNCEPRKTREVRWFPLDQLPRTSPLPPAMPSTPTPASSLPLPDTTLADAATFVSLLRNPLQSPLAEAKLFNSFLTKNLKLTTEN